MNDINGLISRMLFFELYKFMVKNVTFVGFRGGDIPNRLLLVRPGCYHARKIPVSSAEGRREETPGGLEIPHSLPNKNLNIYKMS